MLRHNYQSGVLDLQNDGVFENMMKIIDPLNDQTLLRPENDSELNVQLSAHRYTVDVPNLKYL